ncbi:MAG TPA: cytochrome b [Burkholderiaceae bacterium]|jgi:cytochrome b561
MRYSSVGRFGVLAQCFHWITAILVLVAFIYGPGGSEHRIYSTDNDFDRQLHESLGLSVFFLTALRLLWRTVDRRPVQPDMPRWMHVISQAIQGTLYLLLFAAPLTAICGAWLEGHDLTLLGGLQIPAMLGISHAVGETLAELHGWLGDLILWLAGVHAAAAIYHHFFLKDGVLVAMLPRWLKN